MVGERKEITSFSKTKINNQPDYKVRNNTIILYLRKNKFVQNDRFSMESILKAFLFNALSFLERSCRAHPFLYTRQKLVVFA